MKTKRLLLHICCAPDATVAFQKLKERFTVEGYFYNPNIFPETEYRKRLSFARTLARVWDFPLNEGEYDCENWMGLTRGYEKEPEGRQRCRLCIAKNLRRTAVLAKALGFGWYSTSLFTRRMKDLRMIEAIGYRIGREVKISFFYEPFRREGGFDQSVRYSRELGLYRQTYCGCPYSLPLDDSNGQPGSTQVG